MAIIQSATKRGSPRTSWPLSHTPPGVNPALGLWRARIIIAAATRHSDERDHRKIYRLSTVRAQRVTGNGGRLWRRRAAVPAIPHSAGRAHIALGGRGSPRDSRIRELAVRQETAEGDRGAQAFSAADFFQILRSRKVHAD